MTKISDERLAEMLVGLESATPGPWEVVGSSITDWGREWDASMSMEFVPNGHDEGMNSRSDEDSAHIARCDPDTIRSLITELQHLRAHNSDSAEPVATMHVSDSETLFSKGYDGKGLMGFASKPLYLASPPAKEVDLFELVRVAYFRGYQWCIENPDSPEYATKAAYDYADKTTSVLTNRTPDDEVGNG